MFRFLRNTNGFTLVEIIISIAILSIIVIPLSTPFIQSISINSDARDKMVAAQYAQSLIEEEMADNIIDNLGTPVYPASETINNKAYSAEITVSSYTEDYSYPETDDTAILDSYDYTLRVTESEEGVVTINANTNQVTIDSSSSEFYITLPDPPNTLGLKDDPDDPDFSYTVNDANPVPSEGNIDIHIIAADSDMDLTFFVTNNTFTDCNVYVSKTESGLSSEIAVEAALGPIRVFRNLYDDGDGTNTLFTPYDGSQRLYLVTVRVATGTSFSESNIITEINKLKTLK